MATKNTNTNINQNKIVIQIPKTQQRKKYTPRPKKTLAQAEQDLKNLENADTKYTNTYYPSFQTPQDKNINISVTNPSMYGFNTTPMQEQNITQLDNYQLAEQRRQLQQEQIRRQQLSEENLKRSYSEEEQMRQRALQKEEELRRHAEQFQKEKSSKTPDFPSRLQSLESSVYGEPAGGASSIPSRASIEPTEEQIKLQRIKMFSKEEPLEKRGIQIEKQNPVESRGFSNLPNQDIPLSKPSSKSEEAQKKLKKTGLRGNK